MNIFLLDRDPTLAARYHADVHVVKMVLETAQLLSTALHINSASVPNLYKPTHHNHPCTLWAAASPDHAHYLATLGLALATEYTYRYGKLHKSTGIIRAAYDYYGQQESQGALDFTQFPQCMPPEYRVLGAPVTAYRAYYGSPLKRPLLRYGKTRPAPAWLAL